MTLRRPFTLLETMIAALILTLSAVATMGIIGTARANALRERRRWTREHALVNAAEFWLLAGPDRQLPEELLPEGYTATCELRSVEEDLPDQALESISEWRLGEYEIKILDQDGNVVAEQRIRKILKEDDMGYNSLGAE